MVIVTKLAIIVLIWQITILRISQDMDISVLMIGGNKDGFLFSCIERGSKV